VVVLGLIKGIDVREIFVCIVRAVIGYNVQHDPDVSGVAGFNHLMKIISSTIFSTNLLPVQGSITMVVVWDLVLWNWRDPNGIKSHSLDVVQVIGHAFESTATINIQSRAFVG